MRASRGMGAMSPAKLPKPKKALRKDALVPTKIFAKGGACKAPVRKKP